MADVYPLVIDVTSGQAVRRQLAAGDRLAAPGAFLVSGDIDLGDAATDLLTVLARVDADIYFLAGNTTTYRFRKDNSTVVGQFPGQLAFRGADGGPSDGVSSAGQGGQANFTSGIGGAGSGSIPGAKGGRCLVFPNFGGAGTATAAAGAGGNIDFNGGSGGTNNGGGGGAGGDITFSGGTATGTALHGKITMGANSTRSVEFGNATSNPTIVQLGTGQVTFTGNVDATLGLDVTGALTASGTTSLNGDTDIGDATTDTLTVISRVDADLLFLKGTATLLVKKDDSTVPGETAGAFAFRGAAGGPADATVAGGTGGNAGSLAGPGGAASSDFGAGTGGPHFYTAGQGGLSSAAFPGGTGGAALYRGGFGGTGSATTAAGAGGSITVRGGSGGVNNGGGGNNGADAALQGGPATGAGTKGKVLLGNLTTSAVEIGNATDNSTILQVGTGQVTFTGNVDATLGLDVTGALTVGGSTVSPEWTVTSLKTGAYTATAKQRVIYDPSGGTFTLTLPASPTTGDRVGFKNVTTNTTSVTISGNGANVEDPGTSTLVASFSVSGAFRSLVFFYDGTEWVLE